MDSKSLMIGDWVLIGNNHISITSLQEGKDYVEAQPIPLTPEILEKNGFFAQDQGGGRKDMWIGFGPDCEGDVEIEFDCGIATHLKIDGSFKGEYYTSTNIKSVHELQHALRLCGIDKEIVLCFPELKESKDERIRKALIQHIKYNVSVISGWRKEELITWLEKQGEQKVPVLDFKAKDWYVSKVDCKIHNIYHSVDKVEPKFKVGDVIRNKWSNRTKTIIAIDDYQYTIDDGMPAQPFKVNINEQDNWELVEQNPAWSEEDEIGFCDAMWAIEQARTIAKDENDMGNLWYAERWLKSLKERYTWKPSDEQMEALKVNVDRLIMQYPGNEIVLKSLYNDLKKLKG